MSPTREKDRRAYCPLLKDSGFLSSGSLPCNTAGCVCSCHMALFASPCRNWDLGRCKSADTLTVEEEIVLFF